MADPWKIDDTVPWKTDDTAAVPWKVDDLAAPDTAAPEAPGMFDGFVKAMGKVGSLIPFRSTEGERQRLVKDLGGSVLDQNRSLTDLRAEQELRANTAKPITSGRAFAPSMTAGPANPETFMPPTKLGMNSTAGNVMDVVGRVASAAPQVALNQAGKSMVGIKRMISDSQNPDGSPDIFAQQEFDRQHDSLDARRAKINANMTPAQRGAAAQIGSGIEQAAYALLTMGLATPETLAATFSSLGLGMTVPAWGKAYEEYNKAGLKGSTLGLSALALGVQEGGTEALPFTIGAKATLPALKEVFAGLKAGNAKPLEQMLAFHGKMAGGEIAQEYPSTVLGWGMDRATGDPTATMSRLGQDLVDTTTSMPLQILTQNAIMHGARGAGRVASDTFNRLELGANGPAIADLADLINSEFSPAAAGQIRGAFAFGERPVGVDVGEAPIVQPAAPQAPAATISQPAQGDIHGTQEEGRRQEVLTDGPGFAPGMPLAPVMQGMPLEPVNRLHEDLRDAGHRVASTGKLFGAPPSVVTHEDLVTFRNRLAQLADEGKEGRLWYEDSGKAVLNLAEGDKDKAEKIVGLLAIYSPQQQVSGNTTLALKAYAEYMNNGRITTISNMGKAVAEKAQQWMDGTLGEAQVTGIKRSNFYRNLMREIAPETMGADAQGTTVDMHMARAGGYYSTHISSGVGEDSSGQYQFMDREIKRLAKELGWEPQQGQAAIWAAIKERVDAVYPEVREHAVQQGWMEQIIRTNKYGKESVNYRATSPQGEMQFEKMLLEKAMAGPKPDIKHYSFADAIKERTAQISWEARPGESTGVLPGIHTAPLSQQAEYLQAVDAALRDEQGQDVIAKKIGLPGSFTFFGPSAWQGVVAHGAQTETAFATDRPTQGKVAGFAPAVALMNLYSAIRGLALSQEAVVWHYPNYASTIKEANGVELNFGRALTIPEVEQLYAAISNVAGHTEWAPAVTRTGVRVLNFTDTPNPDFHKAIRAALDTLPSEFPDREFKRFGSIGDYIGNDWRSSPDGQDYRQRIGEAGRPDLLEWADGLRRKVAEVNADFAARYGWDQAQEGKGLPLGAVQQGVPSGRAGLGHILTAAAAVKDEFDSALVNIAGALGGVPVLADVKGWDSAWRKVSKDYGGDAERLMDGVRGSILMPSIDSMDDALAAIKKSYTIAKDLQGKDRIKDRRSGKLLGYRDILINVVMPNGVVGEIQVHVPQIWVVKEAAAHEIYKEWEKAVDAHDAKRANELEIKSRAIYDRAWAAAKSAQYLSLSSSKYSAETSPPDSSTREASKGAIVLPGSTLRNPDSVKMTGMPSTSNKSPTDSWLASLPSFMFPALTSISSEIQVELGDIVAEAKGILSGPGLTAKSGEWSEYNPDLTLGIPRSEMPQIKGNQRPALLKFLLDRGISSERETVDAGTLKPTQREYSRAKTEKWRELRPGSDRTVLASRDGYILDGHHQWMDAVETGKPVQVVRFDSDIKDLLAAVGEFSGAYRSEGMPMGVAAQADADVRSWFDGVDSNLRNEDGSPMVLYHGTTKSFDKFKHSKTGAMGGPAVYLADDAKGAEAYAGDGDGANIIPVYARGRYLNNMDWSKLIGKHGWAGAREEAIRLGYAGVYDTKFENAVAVWDTANIRSAVSGVRMQEGSMAEDAAAQMSWLNAQAQDRGFKDLDELLGKDMGAFTQLAEQWRSDHPAEVLHVEGLYGPYAIQPMDASARVVPPGAFTEKMSERDMARRAIQPLEAKQVKAINSAIADLINAGMPKSWAEGVTYYGLKPVGKGYAHYDPADSSIAVLFTALDSDSAIAKINTRGWMAHEFSHRIDNYRNSGSTMYYFSDESPRMAVTVTPSGKISPNGDLMQEAHDLWMEGELTQYLDYPFMSAVALASDPGGRGLQYAASFTKIEVFAQMGALWMTNKPLIERLAPKWAKFFKEWHDASNQGSIEASRYALRAALQQADSAPDVSGPARREDNGAADHRQDRDVVAVADARPGVGQVRPAARERGGPATVPTAGEAARTAGFLAHPTAKLPGNHEPTHFNYSVALPLKDYRTISSPADVLGTLARQSELFEKEIQKQRRGTVSWDKTYKEAEGIYADLMGISGKTAASMLNRRPGTPAGAAELIARRDLAIKAADDVKQWAAKLRTKGSLQTSKQEMAEFAAALERAGMIHSMFLGARAEAGRALNILRNTSRLSDQAAAIQDLLTHYRGGDSLFTIATQLGEIEDVGSVLRKANAVSTPGIMDAIVELWKNMLLSGPVTHLANVAGNITYGTLRIPQSMIAGLYGKMHISDRDKVYLGESVAMAYGMIAGLGDSLRLAKETFISPEKDEANKAEYHQPAITGRTFHARGLLGRAIDMVGSGVRVPYKVLGATDGFFRGMNASMSMHAAAMRQALKEGGHYWDQGFAHRVAQLVSEARTAIAVPDAKVSKEAFAIAEEAINDGLKYTFNEKLGDLGNGLMRLRNRYPATNFIVPFLRTPMNIFRKSLESTPLAPLSKQWRDEFAAGGHRRDTALAQMTIGTSIGLWVTSMVMSGLITGGGDPEKEARLRRREAGITDYAVKIGDRWYEYRRLEPLGTVMGFSADLAEIWDYMTQEEREHASMMISMAFAQAVTSKTFWKGISDLVNVISDPERYGESWSQSLAGTLVPGAVSQYNDAFGDKLVRDRGVYGPDLKGWDKTKQAFINAIKARVPKTALTPEFNSESLPAKADTWGAPAEKMERTFPYSPIRTSQTTGDPVRMEAYNLRVKGGLPDKEIMGVKLTPRQYWEGFASVSGQTAHDVMADFIADPGWNDLADYMKREIFKEVIDDAKSAARDMMVGDNPGIADAVIEKLGKDENAKPNRPRAR